MKRLLLALIIASSLALPVQLGTASAAGCKALGQTAAAEAQAMGGLGQEARTLVPLNDDIHLFQGLLCS